MPPSRSCKDSIEAAGWLAFAALAYAATFRYDPEISYFRFGAFGWPRAVIALLVISAVGLLVSNWMYRGRAAPADSEAQTSADQRGRRALTFLVPVLFGGAIHYVGLLLTAPLFVLVYCRVLGYRNWARLVATSLLMWGFIALVFVKFLNAHLPMGQGALYTINALLIEALR